MSNLVIGDYTAAITIDGSTNYLLIQPGGASTAYKKINRNVFLGVTGQPADISTVQSLTNKTLDNTNIVTLRDDRFTLQDSGDATKQAKFELSGITTATTRTYTLPNRSDTLVDLGSTQTLTSKTLTAPTINNGSITGTTITTDAIVGQSSANSGTVYGLSIASAKVGTNGVVTASITDAAATAPKLNNSGTWNSSWATQSWSPTITGFSSNPASGIYMYTQVGKQVFLYIVQPNNGTSNATSFTISLPVTARTITNMQWVGYGQIVDNGTVPTNPGLLTIASGGTTLSVSKDWSGTAFTNSGNKRLAIGTIVYEAA